MTTMVTTMVTTMTTTLLGADQQLYKIGDAIQWKWGAMSMGTGLNGPRVLKNGCARQCSSYIQAAMIRWTAMTYEESQWTIKEKLCKAIQQSYYEWGKQSEQAEGSKVYRSYEIYSATTMATTKCLKRDIQRDFVDLHLRTATKGSMTASIRIAASYHILGNTKFYRMEGHARLEEPFNGDEGKQLAKNDDDDDAWHKPKAVQHKNSHPMDMECDGGYQAQTLEQVSMTN
ncbi:hypothetical protein F5J12DRAFT_779410 [Pisolithus orientalis]|uniref:uncharacterized protein n=1 Tax=Pisolithus orientalis TaxID=936130 RepID=UPI0022243F07|nr:uncharacterized protein F5J12DRAFT_779410 [Pisolithus orientalis]KAI6033068.1 hypothetical protein F5J12DRAFT_779410 [Pisolithus orientalis]